MQGLHQSADAAEAMQMGGQIYAHVSSCNFPFRRPPLLAFIRRPSFCFQGSRRTPSRRAASPHSPPPSPTTSSWPHRYSSPPPPPPTLSDSEKKGGWKAFIRSLEWTVCGEQNWEFIRMRRSDFGTGNMFSLPRRRKRKNKREIE